jgi:pimeloyl-ACP methyl ester carboxylesterase
LAGAWSALQFAIRHPDRCRALVLPVPADYLPAGTSIHGDAGARAIFKSDFLV